MKRMEGQVAELVEKSLADHRGPLQESIQHLTKMLGDLHGASESSQVERSTQKRLTFARKSQSSASSSSHRSVVPAGSTDFNKLLGTEWAHKHFKSFNLATIEKEEKEKQEEEAAVNEEWTGEVEGQDTRPNSTVAPDSSYTPLCSAVDETPAESGDGTASASTALGGSFSEPLAKRKDSTRQTVKLARQYRGVANQVCDWKKMEAVVLSTWFEHLIGVIVMLNAIGIGIETDFMAKGIPAPAWLRMISNIFCFIFTCELALRVILNPFRFFDCYKLDTLWNVFDLVVVGFQLFECLDGDKDQLSNFGLLRMCRIFRILRLVRVVRFFVELRTLLSSMLASLESLCWALVVLFLIMYTFGVAFCQIVADEGQHAAYNANLRNSFGTMGWSMMTMLEAITGGISWCDIVQDLIDQIGTWAGVLFIIYIMSCLFAVTNAVTGVFVDKMTSISAQDKATYLAHQLRHLYFDSREEHDRQISLTEFEQSMEDDIMKDFFKNIDVDVTEYKEVFHLLDIDGSGKVDAEELVNGCLRLSGAAKALDLALVIRQNNYVLKILKNLCKTVDPSRSFLTSRSFLKSQIFADGSAASDDDRAHPSPESHPKAHESEPLSGKQRSVRYADD